MNTIDSMERLIYSFSKLPGVGRKTAERYAYRVLELSDEDVEKVEKMSKKEKQLLIQKIEKEMMEAAANLDFERATELRDILFEMKGNL